MPCSCAPTTHAGSFRCGMHRSHSWNGRGTIYRSGEDLELSTASLIEKSLNKDATQKQLSFRKAPAGALPPLARSPSARSPPKGASRLRHVVSSSDEEDEVVTSASVPIGERIPNMKMATGTGGCSYSSSAPGGRGAMFRRMLNESSTSKIFS